MVKRLNCKEVKYLLPDYVQGTISDDDISLVAQHLHECKDCPRELKSLQELYARLESRTESSPAASYWATLLPRIHERIDERKKHYVPRWAPRFVFPLAAAAVIVLVAIRLFSPSAGMPEMTRLSTGTGVREILQQMDSTEVQAIRSEFLASNNLITLIGESNPFSGDDEVLVEMLSGVRLSPLQSDVDTRSLVDNLTDEEADAIVSRLSQKTLIP